MKFLKNLFTRKPKFGLSEIYVQVVTEVALGNRTVLPAAIKMHREYLRQHTEDYKETDAYEFMREVDHIMPDYLHRSQMRKRFLAAHRKTV